MNPPSLPPSLTNQSNLHQLTIQFQLRYPSMFSRNAISNARKLSSQCVGLMGKLTSTSVFSTCQPASMATRSEKNSETSDFRNFYFVKVEKLSDGQCELDEKRVEMEARFAATLLTKKFKDDQRWQIQEIVSGESTNGLLYVK